MRVWLFALLVLVLQGCSETLTPRPVGYPRITFPPKCYEWYDSITPFGFAKPVYAQVRRAVAAPGYDLLFPGHAATLHLTYYHRPWALDTMAEDARRMAYKHAVRADAIEEQFYADSASRVYAVLYRIRGQVASSVQFYAIDSAERYLRGALYFNRRPNIDSLAPAIEFFAEDVQHLIETLRWGR